MQANAREVDMSKCSYNDCDVKFIRKSAHDTYTADAILLQGNNIARPFPVRQNAKQVFVFFSIECPMYLGFTNLNSPVFRDYFNWTMTYRLDSDIPYPYGGIVQSNVTNKEHRKVYDSGNLKSPRVQDINEVYDNPRGIVGKDYEAMYNNKSKHAAWLVSHCVTSSQRERYVKAMQNIVDVDVFGRCSNRTCSRKDQNCEPMIVKTYMFYLAFENSLCKDYITEKAYRWVDHDIIVVVRGARNYPELLPKGTYVNADDFHTAKDLAYYLVELAKNKTEYIRMLKRKDSYRVVRHTKLIQNAYCTLCERLHHLEDHRKSIYNIHDWWTKGMCIHPKL